MLIIDCHAHIVSADERRYPPREHPLRPPGGKASAEDLRRVSQAAGVRAVRAIQTVTFYGYDNSYLCDSVEPNRSPSRKSFDDPGVRKLWKVAWQEGLSIDIFLMRLEMVPSAIRIMKDFPRLTIGFDHCMDLKPGPLLAPSLDAVLKLSRFKNLYPKLDFIGAGSLAKIFINRV